jgi:paraquat-inducible protein B
MSLRANPTAIGLFMLGGAALSVVGVAALASGSWFDRPSTYISYFAESVNGLEVGAPVKFQGVPVGRVTDLLIQIESDRKTFLVPVQYDVDLSRLTSEAGTFLDLDNPGVLGQQISDGLRAQLQMESVVTGQLYVELTYRTDPTPPELRGRPTAHPEIPTSPSLLAAFGTQAGSLVGDVLTILFQVNEMLEAINMPEINQSVVASAQAVERLAGSPAIEAALAGVPAMSEQFNQTMAEMERLAERLGGTIEPLRANLEGTNAEMVLTLETLRGAVADSRGFFNTDSGVGYQMDGAMRSLNDAAEALRALVLALDRNPDMLIRGKKPN